MTGLQIIAEYMGLEKVPCRISVSNVGIVTEGYMHPHYGIPFYVGHLRYRYEYKWIMEVVDKLESDGHEVIISGNRCEINGYNTIADTKVEAIYNAVVECLQRHS